MPTRDQDQAFTDFLTRTGQTASDELRAAFDAGYATRGDHDTKAIRLLRKGGWILPDLDRGYNFAIDNAIRHISFIGGTPRRVLR